MSLSSRRGRLIRRRFLKRSSRNSKERSPRREGRFSRSSRIDGGGDEPYPCIRASRKSINHLRFRVLFILGKPVTSVNETMSRGAEVKGKPRAHLSKDTS